ncbi:hypothetical protein GGD38_006263 [Chitinophagaceae bacterium OAS944]|nr:hypothetical protein [Chitinophagaceae bacterium OAS944]
MKTVLAIVLISSLSSQTVGQYLEKNIIDGKPTVNKLKVFGCNFNPSTAVNQLEMWA